MKDKKAKKKEKDENEKDSAEPSQKPEAGVASIIILWKERWCVGCAIFGRTGFVYTSPIPSCRNWRQSIWKSLRPWRHIYIYIYTYCNPWVQTWVVLEGCFPCWFGCSGTRIKSLLYRSFKPLLFFRQ